MVRRKNNLKNVFRLITALPEDRINVDELELILSEVFNKNLQILQSKSTSIPTDIRRLIKIYDFLKMGNTKEVSLNKVSLQWKQCLKRPPFKIH